MPDIREYLEVDYGTMAAGLVRVPLDPRLTRADFVALCCDCRRPRGRTHSSFADTLNRSDR